MSRTCDFCDRDALKAEIEHLRSRLAEAERDRDAGWKAFYALREQVGRDRYPGLTNIVRTTDSAPAADCPECGGSGVVNYRAFDGTEEGHIEEAACACIAATASQPSVVLTNPWTGEPRDIRDVESDPAGLLMVEPGKPLLAAVQPPAIEGNP